MSKKDYSDVDYSLRYPLAVGLRAFGDTEMRVRPLTEKEEKRYEIRQVARELLEENPEIRIDQVIRHKKMRPFRGPVYPSIPFELSAITSKICGRRLVLAVLAKNDFLATHIQRSSDWISWAL